MKASRTNTWKEEFKSKSVSDRFVDSFRRTPRRLLQKIREFGRREANWSERLKAYWYPPRSMPWILIRSRRTFTTTWIRARADCVTWMWKMSPASWSIVDCLHWKNTSSTTIKWPPISISANVVSSWIIISRTEMVSPQTIECDRKWPSQDLKQIQHKKTGFLRQPNQISSLLKKK